MVSRENPQFSAASCRVLPARLAQLHCGSITSAECLDVRRTRAPDSLNSRILAITLRGSLVMWAVAITTTAVRIVFPEFPSRAENRRFSCSSADRSEMKGPPCYLNGDTRMVNAGHWLLLGNMNLEKQFACYKKERERKRKRESLQLLPSPLP